MSQKYVYFVSYNNNRSQGYTNTFENSEVELGEEITSISQIKKVERILQERLQNKYGIPQGYKSHPAPTVLSFQLLRRSQTE